MWLKHIRFIIMSIAHFQICMLLHLVCTKQYVFVKEPPNYYKQTAINKF